MLGSKWFAFACVPLFSVVLTVYVRFASRKEQHRKWRKEDAAVGMDLMQQGMLALLTLVAGRAVQLGEANRAAEAGARSGLGRNDIVRLREIAQRRTDALVDAVAVLFGVLFILWAVSFIVQQWGWKSDTELSPIVGIALPIFLGFGSILLTIGVAK